MGKRAKRSGPRGFPLNGPIRGTAVYEVEKVVGHSWVDGTSLERAQIYYDVKWTGWPSSDNTIQVTRDFESTHEIVKYWRRLLNAKKASAEEKAIADAMIVAHEWQKGEIVFWNDDQCLRTTPTSRLLREFQYDTSQQDPLDFEDTLDLYQHQVNGLGIFCRNHPHITVENTVDNALPLPIDRLLFRIESRRSSVPTLQFTDKNVFTLSTLSFFEYQQYFMARMNALDPYPSSEDLTVRNPNKTSIMRPMDNHDERVVLNLRRTGDCHWELSARDHIEFGRTVMLLTGERCSPESAEVNMETHGEIHALSNYIQLSDTVCLDTSQRHGFDKYIQHSCEPNCYVDISFPYRDPRDPPLATIRAKTEIDEDDVITVDWFEGFGQFDTTTNYKVGSSQRDHVKCVCDAEECRSVLWLERIRNDQEYTKIPKRKRLEQHVQPFRGLPLPWTNDDR